MTNVVCVHITIACRVWRLSGLRIVNAGWKNYGTGAAEGNVTRRPRVALCGRECTAPLPPHRGPVCDALARSILQYIFTFLYIVTTRRNFCNRFIHFFPAATDIRPDRQPQSRSARAEPFVAASSRRTTPVTATVATPDATGQRFLIREYSPTTYLRARTVFACQRG